MVRISNRIFVLTLTSFLMLVAASSCGKKTASEDDDSAEDDRVGLGEECNDPYGPLCREGSCHPNLEICSLDCETDDDCSFEIEGERAVCQPVGDEKWCDAPCDEESNSLCIDGHSVTCADDPCAEGEACDDYFGCRPAVGSPCGDGCDSNNCLTSGVCGVALGSECTAENCDFCAEILEQPGTTYCQIPCSDQGDCEVFDPEQIYDEANERHRCYGGIESPTSYLCRPSCAFQGCSECVPDSYFGEQNIGYCDLDLVIADGMGGASN